MINKIAFLFFLAVVFGSTVLQAQRMIPAGALPTRYNGGFAGEAGVPRVASFSYFTDTDYMIFSDPPLRSNWTSVGSLISVDHFLKKIRSGVAFTVGHERSDYFSYTAASLAISPKFSFRGKYTFAPFVDLSFVRENFLWEAGLTPAPYKRNDYILKTGFLINSEKAYVGISAEVFDFTTTTYSDNKIRFLSEIKYVLQAGYTFQRKPDSKFSFTPQILFTYQRYNTGLYSGLEDWYDDTALDINLSFRYKKFITGLNNTGIMFGFQNDRFKLQVSNFFANTFRAYSGSIGLRYIIQENPSAKMSGF
jgi:hypothetical protein